MKVVTESVKLVLLKFECNKITLSGLVFKPNT